MNPSVNTKSILTAESLGDIHSQRNRLWDTSHVALPTVRAASLENWISKFGDSQLQIPTVRDGGQAKWATRIYETAHLTAAPEAFGKTALKAAQQIKPLQHQEQIPKLGATRFLDCVSKKPTYPSTVEVETSDSQPLVKL